MTVCQVKSESSLLQDWVVAVADQLGAHGLGLFDVRVWSNLHVDELVVGCSSWECGILFFLERIDQSVRIRDLGTSGHLHVITVQRRRNGRIISPRRSGSRSLRGWRR